MLQIGGFAIGTVAEIEKTRALRVTPRAVDYDTLGAYAKALASGTMAAGLGAAAPIWALRYSGANLCLIRRLRLSAGNAGTGFAAGVAIFNLFVARAFTASDSGGTGGTLSGNNGKLRTNMATTAMGDVRIASTGTLTAGTRTKDSDPIASIVAPISTTVGIVMVPANTPVFEPRPGEQPVVLAQNEGLVIEATVPATGTWGFSVSVEYDEVPLATY
jgi:hypothetical protein